MFHSVYLNLYFRNLFCFKRRQKLFANWLKVKEIDLQNEWVQQLQPFTKRLFEMIFKNERR